MIITEAQRFEMHLGLRKTMGDDVANTLMEHLPPSGWTDLARKHDITLVEHEIEFIKEEIRRLDHKMNIMIASSLTFGLAIVVMLVQVQISIANL